MKGFDFTTFKNLNDLKKYVEKGLSNGDINTINMLKSNSNKSALDIYKEKLENSCTKVKEFLFTRIKYHAVQLEKYTDEEINNFYDYIKHEVKNENGKLSARVFWEDFDDGELLNIFKKAEIDAKNDGIYKNIIRS